MFKDPAWDPRTLDFDSHVALVDGRDEHRILDATQTDLGGFVNRGGKLLLYQGWAENGIPPRNVVNYVASVRASTRNANDAVRLFMIPGMGHCGGGDCATTFDMVAAPERWVTSGPPPASLSLQPSRGPPPTPTGPATRDRGDGRVSVPPGERTTTPRTGETD